MRREEGLQVVRPMCGSKYVRTACKQGQVTDKGQGVYYTHSMVVCCTVCAGGTEQAACMLERLFVCLPTGVG